MGAVLSIWPARALATQPIVHFAPKPALLAVKKDQNNTAPEELSIRTLIETRCTSLLRPFNPPWWLFNGHLQTLYCVFGDFSKHDLVSYDRTYLRLADGGTIGLDFTPPNSTHLRDDTPIVVVQHGLTGGSYESYVRAILSKACAKVEDGGLGYRAVVINFRGCAGVPITSQLLYSAGHTDDTRQALAYIAYKFPKAPLLGLGFSLGSNVITRYLAEEGEQTRLLSACTLACPWDLERNNDGLLRSFLGKHIYSKGMGSNLLNLLKRHAKAFVADPNHHVTKAAYVAFSLKNPTLEQFDETFTRVAGGPAPHFPFPNAQEYYRWASSHHVVKDITVPYLAINAADDPVVRHVPMDGAGNGWAVMVLTDGGGHLGWFEPGYKRLERWTTKPVIEWLELLGMSVVHAESKGSKLYVDGDGFLREEGRPRLGCKEIASHAIIDSNESEEGLLQGL
ncbi:AB-hydrolase YheT [Cyathus striatus]|nr:AB-hydrolase YheT [Cyathus striatus]